MKKYIYSFLILVGTTKPVYAELNNCVSLLSKIEKQIQTHSDDYDQLMKEKWQRKIVLEDLKNQFYKNGVVDWKGFWEFANQQPGTWVKIKSADNKSTKQIRVLFLRSRSGEPDGVKYFFGGIGYDIERYLTEDHQFVDHMSFNSHNVMIEKGGLTDILDYLTRMDQGLEAHEILHADDEAKEDFRTIEVVKEMLRVNEVSAPQKADIMALSMGGWKLIHMASIKKYQKHIGEITLFDPGARSLDRHFNEAIYHSQNIMNALSLMQQTLIQSFDSHLAHFFNMFGMNSPVKMSLFEEYLLLNKIDQQLYSHSAGGMMKMMFGRLREDPLRLEYALARVVGIREVDGVKEIAKISPETDIRLIIGGQDDIVPPSLFVKIIEAMIARPKKANGEQNYSIMYIPDMGHDSPASKDPSTIRRMEESLDGYQENAAWIVESDGSLHKSTPEKIIKLLKATTPQWFKENIQRLMSGVQGGH